MQLATNNLEINRVNGFITNISLSINKLNLSLDVGHEIKDLGKILPTLEQHNNELDVLLYKLVWAIERRMPSFSNKAESSIIKIIMCSWLSFSIIRI